eukprot:622169-Amphidinium_carterae.1
MPLQSLAWLSAVLTVLDLGHFSPCLLARNFACAYASPLYETSHHTGTREKTIPSKMTTLPCEPPRSAGPSQ